MKARVLTRTTAYLATLVALLASFSISGPSLEAAPSSNYYDEVFHRNGSVRRQYAEILKIYQQLSPNQISRFRKRSAGTLSGDYPFLPIPRVFTQAEMETLTRGVEQRGKALRLFLEDHYSKKQYLRDGIIPPATAERIIRRNGEWDWQGFVKPKHIHFTYGPDIVRGPNGKFFVVEDNPGNVGGQGDVLALREGMLQLIPSYRDSVVRSHPERFYKNLIEVYRRMAFPKDGAIVIAQYERSYLADNEDERFDSLMKDLGVETVRINFHNPKDGRIKKKLVTRKDGVYLEHTLSNGRKERKRVGLVVVNMEPKDLDSSHESVPSIVDEAKEMLEDDELDPKHREAILELLHPSSGKIDLKKLEAYLRGPSNLPHSLDENLGVKGLLNAFFNNQVALSYPPGLEFIGDKEFYLYVPNLIRYYLDEEPILSNLETGTFTKQNSKGEWVFDPARLKTILSHFEDYVLKTVDSRGGDGVRVGKKVSRSEFKEFAEKIPENPDAFIWQKFLNLSQLMGHLVDTRVISYIHSGGAVIMDTPFGRAIPVDGDGKVNISASGSGTAVLIYDENACPKKLLAVPKSQTAR